MSGSTSRVTSLVAVLPLQTSTFPGASALLSSVFLPSSCANTTEAGIGKNVFGSRLSRSHGVLTLKSTSTLYSHPFSLPTQLPDRHFRCCPERSVLCGSTMPMRPPSRRYRSATRAKNRVETSWFAAFFPPAQVPYVRWLRRTNSSRTMSALLEYVNHGGLPTITSTFDSDITAGRTMLRR